MTAERSVREWLARLRRVFPFLGRQRHFADISGDRYGVQKMTPIAKVLADAGRDSATPAD